MSKKNIVAKSGKQLYLNRIFNRGMLYTSSEMLEGFAKVISNFDITPTGDSAIPRKPYSTFVDQLIAQNSEHFYPVKFNQAVNIQHYIKFNHIISENYFYNKVLEASYTSKFVIPSIEMFSRPYSNNVNFNSTILSAKENTNLSYNPNYFMDLTLSFLENENKLQIKDNDKNIINVYNPVMTEHDIDINNIPDSIDNINTINVIDGDTIWITRNGEKIKCRLLCINSPEKGLKWYTYGKEFLEKLIVLGNATYDNLYTTRIRVELEGSTDSYGRSLAYMYLDVYDTTQEQQTTCSNCNGTKHILSNETETELVDCHMCGGDGARPCGICNGTGFTSPICWNCGGDGRIICSQCGGDGWIDNATGLGVPEDTPGAVLCPVCEGFKELDCDNCGGSGTLEPQPCGVNHIPGTYNVVCPYCNGTGKRSQTITKTVYITCPTCNGTGLIGAGIESTYGRYTYNINQIMVQEGLAIVDYVYKDYFYIEDLISSYKHSFENKYRMHNTQETDPLYIAQKNQVELSIDREDYIIEAIELNETKPIIHNVNSKTKQINFIKINYLDAIGFIGRIITPDKNNNPEIYYQGLIILKCKLRENNDPYFEIELPSNNLQGNLPDVITASTTGFNLYNDELIHTEDTEDYLYPTFIRGVIATLSGHEKTIVNTALRNDKITLKAIMNNTFYTNTYKPDFNYKINYSLYGQTDTADTSTLFIARAKLCTYYSRIATPYIFKENNKVKLIFKTTTTAYEGIADIKLKVKNPLTNEMDPFLLLSMYLQDNNEVHDEIIDIYKYVDGVPTKISKPTITDVGLGYKEYSLTPNPDFLLVDDAEYQLSVEHITSDFYDLEVRLQYSGPESTTLIESNLEKIDTAELILNDANYVQIYPETDKLYTNIFMKIDSLDIEYTDNKTQNIKIPFVNKVFIINESFDNYVLETEFGNIDFVINTLLSKTSNSIDYITAAVLRITNTLNINTTLQLDGKWQYAKYNTDAFIDITPFNLLYYVNEEGTCTKVKNPITTQDWIPETAGKFAIKFILQPRYKFNYNGVDYFYTNDLQASSVVMPLLKVDYELEIVDTEKLKEDLNIKDCTRLCIFNGQIGLYGPYTKTNTIFFSMFEQPWYYNFPYYSIDVGEQIIYATEYNSNLVIFGKNNIFMLTSIGTVTEAVLSKIYNNLSISTSDISSVSTLGTNLLFFSGGVGYIVVTNKYYNDPTNINIYKLTENIDQVLLNPESLIRLINNVSITHNIDIIYIERKVFIDTTYINVIHNYTYKINNVDYYSVVIYRYNQNYKYWTIYSIPNQGIKKIISFYTFEPNLGVQFTIVDSADKLNNMYVNDKIGVFKDNFAGVDYPIETIINSGFLGVDTLNDKRFKDLIFDFNNIAGKSAINIKCSFFVDGIPIVIGGETSPIIVDDYGGLADETEYTEGQSQFLHISNRGDTYTQIYGAEFDLSNSHYTTSGRCHFRLPVFGKGRLPSFVLKLSSENIYEFLSFSLIYKEKNINRRR